MELNYQDGKVRSWQLAQVPRRDIETDYRGKCGGTEIDLPAGGMSCFLLVALPGAVVRD